MYKRNNIHRNFTLVLLLVLVITACGINIESPLANIKTGPMQSVDIQVPLSAMSTDVELDLEFIAGVLRITPGATEYLVSGTAEFNAVDFEPMIEATGSSFSLKAGDMKIEGIPNIHDEITNEWDLQLANIPMSLNITAGAYDGELELGGLSLEKLTISEIGSDVTVGFSRPNQVVMSSFTYSTGGSNLVLKGLANANFEQMNFDSGAGDYTLSFDGDLQRDANVTIKTGAASVTIIVPVGVNSKVTYNGGLSSVNVAGEWNQNENFYSLSGSGPTITITVDLGLGALNLKSE